VTPSSSITVSWGAATDDVGVTGYRGFRTGVQVGTATTTSYTDTGPTAGTTYSYTVAAADASGKVSAQSAMPASGDLRRHRPDRDTGSCRHADRAE
jgi:chitodextrinase